MKKTADRILRVGLIANSDKPACRHLARQAARLIRSSGRKVLTDQATAQLTGLRTETFSGTASLRDAADLLMVFGGDGTMLRVAREMAGSLTPIVGINVGSLGFLTDVPANQLPAALRQIWAGQIRIESRWLMEATGRGAGGKLFERAFNDFVITRGAQPRMIELEVRVQDDLVTHYRGDGLIICSPTGSTAYSLAAGGAVVSPGADVFALTPICAHTLSNRSVVISSDSIIHVRILSRRVETVLTADGQKIVPLAPDDVVTIQRSRHGVRLLHLNGSSFFNTLRRKLNWSGTLV